MANVTVRSIGVLSVAKINCVIAAVFGIFIGVIYGLMFMVFGAIGVGSRNGGAAGGASIALGLGMMIGIPIMYALIGFIGGAVSALVYNVAAGMIGGIEMELQNEGE